MNLRKIFAGTVLLMLMGGILFSFISSLVAEGQVSRGGSGVFLSPQGVVAGNNTSPGVFFNGDPNTGIFSPGADRFGVAQNGISTLFSSATGGWTIGSSSGTSAHTFQSLGDLNLSLVGSGGAFSSRLYFSSAGGGGGFIVGAPGGTEVRNAANSQTNLSISNSGNVTIGPSGSSEVHAVNGGLTTTRSQPAVAGVPGIFNYAASNGGGNSAAVTTDINFASDAIWNINVIAAGTGVGLPVCWGTFGYSGGDGFRGLCQGSVGAFTTAFSNDGGKVRLTFTISGATSVTFRVMIMGRHF